MYDIPSLYIDGQTMYQRRGAIVKQFEEDPNCRVLLFSRVGGVGLNLMCADTVIFLVSELEGLKTSDRLCITS